MGGAYSAFLINTFASQFFIAASITLIFELFFEFFFSKIQHSALLISEYFLNKEHLVNIAAPET